jgi:hypothetical protein
MAMSGVQYILYVYIGILEHCNNRQSESMRQEARANATGPDVGFSELQLPFWVGLIDDLSGVRSCIASSGRLVIQTRIQYRIRRSGRA